MHEISTDFGYLRYRYGTGGNVEITDLRVYEKRKGYGTQLMRLFCDRLQSTPPYYSVYVFTLGSNTDAHQAYKSWGFKLTKVPNLYKDDETIIGTVSFEVLSKRIYEGG